MAGWLDDLEIRLDSAQLEIELGNIVFDQLYILYLIKSFVDVLKVVIRTKMKNFNNGCPWIVTYCVLSRVASQQKKKELDIICPKPRKVAYV